MKKISTVAGVIGMIVLGPACDDGGATPPDSTVDTQPLPSTGSTANEAAVNEAAVPLFTYKFDPAEGWPGASDDGRLILDDGCIVLQQEDGVAAVAVPREYRLVQEDGHAQLVSERYPTIPLDEPITIYGGLLLEGALDQLSASDPSGCSGRGEMFLLVPHDMQ